MQPRDSWRYAGRWGKVAFRSVKRRGPAVVGRLIDDHVGKDALLSNQDWTQRPSGVIPWKFLAPSGPLAALRCGDLDAPMVVLIPGVGESKEDFQRLMPLLDEGGYQCVAIDLAGHHESANDELFEAHAYDWNLFAKDVEALLEITGPAHLLGSSFGGQVASVVSISRPELVLSLSLLSVPPASGNVFEKVRFTKGVAKRANPRVLGHLLSKIAAVRAFMTDGEERARFKRHNRRSVRDIFTLMADTPNVGEALVEVSVPTLVAAREDDWWGGDQHLEFAKQIGAQAHIYRTTGEPHVVAPHQVARDLTFMLDAAESALNKGGAAA